MSFKPKSVFADGVPTAKAAAPAPRGPVLPSTPPVERRVPGSVFPGRGVSATADIETSIRNNPICKGLDTITLSRVLEIQRGLDINDAKKIGDFCKPITEQYASMVNAMEELVAGKARIVSGDINKALAIIQSIDPQKLLTPKAVSMWDVVMRRATKAEYEEQKDVSIVVRKIIRALDEVEDLAVSIAAVNSTWELRISSLDDTYRQNERNHKQLVMHVVAGKLKVEHEQTVVIPRMEKELKRDDFFKIQDLAYYKDAVKRFELKVLDLELIAQMMLLKAPEIRTLQMSLKNSADNARRLVTTTIPMWRTQCSLFMDMLMQGNYPTVDAAYAGITVSHPGFIKKLTAMQREVAEDFTK